jgi:HK97 family phage prohead protease
VFNATSVDLGGFVEELMPGCFDGVLEDDCRCLRNHLDDVILGRTEAATLTLRVDDVGLGFDCDLPDTSAGWDTAELVRRRDITGCSFQFRIAPDGDEWDFNQAVARRRVTRVSRLYDVGPVTFPAYISTSVDMRSFRDARAKALAVRKAAEFRVINTSLSIARARLRLVSG